MYISDLPRKLKNIAKKYRKESAEMYKNDPETKQKTLNTNMLVRAFIWEDTKEGHKFWEKLATQC